IIRVMSSSCCFEAATITAFMTQTRAAQIARLHSMERSGEAFTACGHQGDAMLTVEDKRTCGRRTRLQERDFMTRTTLPELKLVMNVESAAGIRKRTTSPRN